MAVSSTVGQVQPQTPNVIAAVPCQKPAGWSVTQDIRVSTRCIEPCLPSADPERDSFQIDQHAPIDDPRGKGPYPEFVIQQGPPGGEVELPAMPWTCKSRSRFIERQLPGSRRDEAAAQHAMAHRTALMRAQIVHREDPVAPADDADLPRPDIDDPHLPCRKFIGRADIDAHASTMRGRRQLCFAPTVELHRILEENPAMPALRQLGRYVLDLVGVPMWIVGRIDQPVGAIDPAQQLDDLLALGEISSGCVVSQTCSATYSLGSRRSHGTSRRKPL